MAHEVIHPHTPWTTLEESFLGRLWRRLFSTTGRVSECKGGATRPGKCLGEVFPRPPFSLRVRAPAGFGENLLSSSRPRVCVFFVCCTWQGFSRIMHDTICASGQEAFKISRGRARLGQEVFEVSRVGFGEFSNPTGCVGSPCDPI